MDLEEIMRRLGAGGRWQIRTYMVYAVTQLVIPWAAFAGLFTLDTPSFHCKTPDGSSPNRTLPRQYVDGKWRWSQCTMFTNVTDMNNSTLYRREANHQNSSLITTACTNGYEYDDSYDSTIVTEWDLVCDKDPLTELPLTIGSIGHFLGMMVMSRLSDVLGRKPVFLLSVYAGCILGLVLAFSPNLTAYCMFTFIRGFLSCNIAMLCMILSLELFPPERRTLAALGLNISWLIGAVAYTPVAYFIRNWRILLLVSEAPKLVTVLFIWLSVESLTWLVSQSRYSDAEVIIRRAAKFNNVVLPDELFCSNPRDPKEDMTSSEKQTIWKLVFERIQEFLSSVYRIMKCDNLCSRTDKLNYGMLDLLKTPKMRRYTLILCYLWFSHMFVYRSLSLTVTYLHGNRYLNFFLYQLCELPGYLFGFLAFQRVGRRLPICILQIISGAALIVTVIQKFHSTEHLQWLTITFYLIGKVSIASALSGLWLMSPEIFPTNLRNRGTGICGIFSTIAGFLSPYARTMTREIAWPWIPPVCFGVLAVIAGGITLFLPETHKRKLPETVEEVEQWTQKMDAHSDKVTLVEMDFADAEILRNDSSDHINEKDFQPVSLY